MMIASDLLLDEILRFFNLTYKTVVILVAGKSRALKYMDYLGLVFIMVNLKLFFTKSK